MNGSVIALGLVGILGIGLLVGFVALIVAACRKSSRCGVGSVLGTIAFLFAAGFVAVGLLLPALSRRSNVTVTGGPMPVPSVSVGGPASTSMATATTSHPARKTVVINARHSRHVGAPPFVKYVLAGISLAALLVLARVAVFGRKNGGYGPAARIVATAAFVGLCALLASIRPIL